MSVEIYYDALQEAEWFKSLSAKLQTAKMSRLQNRGMNANPLVNELITYDRPDIILVVNGKPVLVLEKTEEVPSGHNVGQRMGRLAKAVEKSIPIVKFIPFLAMKHGKYAGKCHIRPNLLIAFQKIKIIHGVYALAVNWKCNEKYELVRDGSQNLKIAELIDQFIGNNYSFQGLDIVKTIETEMASEIASRQASTIKYRSFEPSLTEVDTSELSNKYILNKFIIQRKKSIIYQIKMTPEKCRREDPYTGNQFILDYCYCRIGPRVSERCKNFILNFPLIKKKRWIAANPNDPARKSSLWYSLADLLIFSDGVMVRGVDYGTN